MCWQKILLLTGIRIIGICIAGISVSVSVSVSIGICVSIGVCIRIGVSVSVSPSGPPSASIETCPSCGVRRRASRFGEIFDFERPRSGRSLGVGGPPRRRTFLRGSKTLSCACTASARIRLRILKNFNSEKRLVQSQRTSAFFRRKNTLLKAVFNLWNPIWQSRMPIS